MSIKLCGLVDGCEFSMESGVETAATVQSTKKMAYKGVHCLLPPCKLYKSN